MKSFNPETNIISDDGEEIAVYDPLTFSVESPKALHHKTQTAITKLLEDDFAMEVRDFSIEIDSDPEDEEDEEDEEKGAPHVESRTIPPCPPSKPAMGDKTPEVIEWHRQHSTPEDFAKRYGNRVIPDFNDATENEERGLPDDEEEEDATPPKVLS